MTTSYPVLGDQIAADAQNANRVFAIALGLACLVHIGVLVNLDLHAPKKTYPPITAPIEVVIYDETPQEQPQDAAPDPRESAPVPLPEPAEVPIEPAIPVPEAAPTIEVDTPIEVMPEEPAAEEPPPLAAILASRSNEIAALAARIEARANAYASQPRRKAISTATRDYKYAAYLDGWRRKVERIGNLNYPDEAKRHKMYGSLILHVAVRADGSVERVRVLRSSGYDVLDAAAIRIVELAAPYAPFPPSIRAETDVLDITRTWQFLRGDRIGWE